MRGAKVYRWALAAVSLVYVGLMATLVAACAAAAAVSGDLAALAISLLLIIPTAWLFAYLVRVEQRRRARLTERSAR